MENELPNRKPTRLRSFDYNNIGAYFITICTQNKQQILSRIVGGDVLDAPQNVKLLPYGKIAEKYLNQMNDFYSNIEIDQYVIMPNHIHIMLFVLDDGTVTNKTACGFVERIACNSLTSPPTRQHSAVSQFVSTFKRFCNKEYGKNIWQRQFHDHIIRNRKDYEEHLKYIYENPLRWCYDELYSEL